MIEITEEEYAKVKDLLEKDKKEFTDLSSLIGQKVFIRTVTYHLVGQVESIFANTFLKLASASWVADSGRFSNAIKTGELDEVEPTGTAFVNMSSVVDFYIWTHSLPMEQK